MRDPIYADALRGFEHTFLTPFVDVKKKYVNSITLLREQ
jgi:hypothetical protein